MAELVDSGPGWSRKGRKADDSGVVDENAVGQLRWRARETGGGGAVEVWSSVPRQQGWPCLWAAKTVKNGTTSRL